MAYLARQDIIFSGAIFHVTWQCHNHDWLLKDDSLKQLYYDLLLKYKDLYGISIFSYCLMDNHPHITGQTATANGLSRFMQTINSILARTINKKLKRSGQAIMDRFKSPIIHTDNDLLNVMKYNDLNPTRTKNRIHPRDYKWSSYTFYAYGKKNPLITVSPAYLMLENTDNDRQIEYRRMIDEIIEHEGLEKKNYSKVAYIGDPAWVRIKYEEIKQIKKAAYLIRQRHMMRILSSSSPP